MSTDDLKLLSNAASLEQMFKEFQQQMQCQMEELHKKVAALKEDHGPHATRRDAGPWG